MRARHTPVINLVVNESDQERCFEAARNGPDRPYRDDRIERPDKAGALADDHPVLSGPACQEVDR